MRTELNPNDFLRVDASNDPVTGDLRMGTTNRLEFFDATNYIYSPSTLAMTIRALNLSIDGTMTLTTGGNLNLGADGTNESQMTLYSLSAGQRILYDPNAGGTAGIESTLEFIGGAALVFGDVNAACYYDSGSDSVKMAGTGLGGADGTTWNFINNVTFDDDVSIVGTTTLDTGLTGVLQATSGVVSAGTLSVSDISDIATTYLKLDATNDPITGQLDIDSEVAIRGTPSSVHALLVGSTGSSSIQNGVNISITPDVAQSAHGLLGTLALAPTAAGKTFRALAFSNNLSGNVSTAVSEITGVRVSNSIVNVADAGYDGAVTAMYGGYFSNGLADLASTTHSTITNMYGAYVTASNTGDATITNNYGYYVQSSAAADTLNVGLYVGNITSATTNYAIQTNTGTVSFGDDVELVAGGIGQTLTIGPSGNQAVMQCVQPGGLATRQFVISAIRNTVISEEAPGTYFDTGYTLSLQSDSTQTWLEILNSGGAGKGAFFGMLNDAFELYNYQGWDQGSGSYPTNFYGGFGAALQLVLDNTGAVFQENVSILDNKDFEIGTGVDGTISSNGTDVTFAATADLNLNPTSDLVLQHLTGPGVLEIDASEVVSVRANAYCSVTTTANSTAAATTRNVFDSDNYTSYTSTANVSALGITYTSSTGEFTVTAAGIYVITVNLNLQISSSDEVDIELRKNTVAFYNHDTFVHSAVDPVHRTITVVVEAAASDDFEVWCGSTDGIDSTTFHGGCTYSMYKVATEES